jgi:phosphoribosylformylglycinamidine synthase subunit PurS
MRARVHVRLKNSVLDPQGAAIARALAQLGFAGVREVRQGKMIELQLDDGDRVEAEVRVRAMCERLLANPVIETFTVTIDQ